MFPHGVYIFRQQLLVCVQNNQNTLATSKVGAATTALQFLVQLFNCENSFFNKGNKFRSQQPQGATTNTTNTTVVKFTGART
jgi:hypothetical protein